MSPVDLPLDDWLRSAAKALGHVAGSADDRRRIVGEIQRRLDEHEAPAAAAWAAPMPIANAEWQMARLSPRCIVENYLFADVGALIAPGATGKTTLVLYEAIHIALGLPLWGLRVVTPGAVLIITAEDRREYLVARLREICAALGLSDAQCHRVRQLVRIDDCTRTLRRLTAVVGDAVRPSEFAAEIVQGCTEGNFQPVLVQFDPLVSFGVGEARVNDAEQGLIEAARIIVAELECCARFTHHSGKGNARDKAVDQYAGRGGSALPDGCRMVHVLATMDAADALKLCAYDLADDESAFALHRPKISYAPPRQPPIYVRRAGFTFRLLTACAPKSDEQQGAADDDQLLRFLAAQVASGMRYTARTLEAARPPSISRDRARASVARLIASGRVEDVAIEPRPTNGARTFLQPRTAAHRGEVQP